MRILRGAVEHAARVLAALMWKLLAQAALHCHVIVDAASRRVDSTWGRGGSHMDSSPYTVENIAGAVENGQRSVDTAML